MQMAAASFEKDGIVVIYQGRERTASYPLSEDRELEIRLPDGGLNLLVIRDGEAWIVEADCPDRLCVKQGHISGNGQALICLPHRLTITIENGAASDLDAVAG